MVRSYRGVGLVLLTLLVVAPLTLFAVLSLFEEESVDSIRLSVDGVAWDTEVGGTLLASPTPWTPGESRSAVVYLRNGGPAPVDAEVTVLCRTGDEQVRAGRLTLTAQVGDAEPTVFPVATGPHDVAVDGLDSDTVVPLTLTARFSQDAPIGSTVDSEDLRFRFSVTGARTDDSRAPSLLDATGAQLWLAPVLLVVGGTLLVVQARRRTRRPPADSGS